MQISQREKWHNEQIVAMLYKNVVGAIIGSVFNISIVSFVLVAIYPTIGLLAWFISGQIVNLIRFYTYRLYITDIKRYPTYTWLKAHRVLTFFSGCVYGLLAVFFFSSEHPLYQILVILLSGGMGAAAVGTHSVDRLTFQLFLFSAVIPLILRCLYEGTEVHTVLAAMLCVLILIMTRAAKQTKDIIIDNIYMSQSLRYRATHDALVDLLNRDEFKREFKTVVLERDLSAVDNVISMIFIDLDNFKTLNDTFGHQAGDEALINIGEIIRNSIRKFDIAARFGGDEFMILIQSESVDQAIKVAEKIQLKINEFQQDAKEESAALGASIGIGYCKLNSASFDKLLTVADKACYRAKKNGKGQMFVEELKD